MYSFFRLFKTPSFVVLNNNNPKCTKRTEELLSLSKCLEFKTDARALLFDQFFSDIFLRVAVAIVMGSNQLCNGI